MNEELNIDYDKKLELEKFAQESVEISTEYANARYNFAVAKLKMDSRLADAYKNQTIKESLAMEKAYIQLIIGNPEANLEYDTMVKEEHAYKGLEAVLKARQGKISLNQSLMNIKKMIG